MFCSVKICFVHNVVEVTTYFKTKMDPTENMTIVREVKLGRN